jgi:hypothetical protein
MAVDALLGLLSVVSLACVAQRVPASCVGEVSSAAVSVASLVPRCCEATVADDPPLPLLAPYRPLLPAETNTRALCVRMC